MILSVFVKKKLAGKKLHPKHTLVQSICGIVLRPGRHFENFILARAIKYLPTADIEETFHTLSLKKNRNILFKVLRIVSKLSKREHMKNVTQINTFY